MVIGHFYFVNFLFFIIWILSVVTQVYSVRTQRKQYYSVQAVNVEPLLLKSFCFIVINLLYFCTAYFSFILSNRDRPDEEHNPNTLRKPTLLGLGPSCHAPTPTYDHHHPHHHSHQCKHHHPHHHCPH